MFKKKNKFTNEVNRLSNLIVKFKNDSADGFEALSIETIESYLSELKELYKMVTFTMSNGQPNDSYTMQLFQKGMKEMQVEISYQYKRNFAIYEDTSIRSNDPSDIPESVAKVKECTVTKIHEAVDYFGSFIDGYFDFGPKERFTPHSIDEILQVLEQADWTRYTIKFGAPQPPYKERFNKILNKAIKSYVEDFLAK